VIGPGSAAAAGSSAAIALPIISEVAAAIAEIAMIFFIESSYKLKKLA
jgi:hypothetical protein